MNVFDLFARISLDTSEYEGALNEASSKTAGIAKNIGGGLAKAAKIGAAAIGAATTASVAFAASSVNVGMSFDSAMSQVAATMGTTVDQISELRDFAIEMGSATSFSATEAAEALNYMALAGYSADESMEALPNVLNLAAAGGMNLAAASDMITDSQTALGLSFEETSKMVDQMAKTASTTNTSVAQLGDAILTVGGTAKELSGGTDELNAVLGIFADNGIKGAEAGTHLRNIMLAMTPTTDAAKSAFEQLGIQAYDSGGNLRSLDAVFLELSESLDGMTSEERTDILNKIFNKTDLATVNALLSTTSERWEEVYTAIGDADGAAKAMADTQLDNLAGDITLFKSALEGAKIVLSDQLTPSLRNFVQFGTNAISQLTEAFQEEGLSGAMEALGTILSDGLNMIIESLPDFVEAGMKLLGAIGQGLLDNIDVILDAGLQIIVMLVEGLVEAFPKIVDAIIEIIPKIVDTIVSLLPQIVEAGFQIILAVAYGIIDALPEIIPTIVNVILEIVDILTDPENLILLIEAAVEIMLAIAKGLVESIPEITARAPEIIMKLVLALLAMIPVVITAVIQIGIAIIKGIWEGVKSAAVAFMENLKKLIHDIVEGVKKMLGIHSPSRVFADIGENMALGLGEGWDDAFGRVKDQIENGMDFGTASVGLDFRNGSGMSGGIAENAQSQDRDIVINITSEIDGAVLSRKMVRYNTRAQNLVGSSMVNFSKT